MSDAALQREKLNMLRRHLKDRGIRDARVIDAMARVPRERFIDDELRGEAYADRALGIGCEQTISQPFIVALMTQALALRGEEKVLEVGTGSGYQTAILAELAREVVSIERYELLSRRAGEALSALGYGRVKLGVGDGTLGWPSDSPFDRIVVTAAAPSIPPPLWEQLAPGGILVIPLGGRDHQVLESIRKVSGEPVHAALTPCRFVPLVGAAGWAAEL